MTRGRRLSITLALVLALMASALVIVEHKHRSRMLISEIEALDSEYLRLRSERDQLELEASTWATLGRVEQVATERLDMSEPDVYSIVVVAP